LPQLSKFMATKRDLIRWFIKEVLWVTPRNVACFIEGQCNDALYRVYSSELSEMLREKDSTLRLKRIKNQDDKYAYTLRAKTLPTFLFNHDVCLRNVIGKFLHDQGMHDVSFAKPADASIQQYCFELDNGHMDQGQLKEKLVSFYTKVNVQAVFIMRHRECPHLEAKRLQKIFKLSEELFPYMPNKVLGTCYTEYLKNGIIQNRKGEVKIKPHRQLNLF